MACGVETLRKRQLPRPAPRKAQRQQFTVRERGVRNRSTPHSGEQRGDFAWSITECSETHPYPNRFRRQQRLELLVRPQVELPMRQRVELLLLERQGGGGRARG